MINKTQIDQSLPVKLLPLSSLSAVQEDELPVSLRTDTVLMHMGFDSNQRSVLEGDGEGCCCWRRFIDLLVSEL